MKSHLNELFDDYRPEFDQANPEFTFGCLGSYQNDDNKSINSLDSLDSDFLDEMN